MRQNKLRYNKKINIWNRVRFSLWGKKIIVNLILFPKLWHIHRPNLCYSKIYQKGNWKRNIQFPLKQEKVQLPNHLAQLSIWRGVLRILDIDTQFNFIKIKGIQRLLNCTNALWKDLVLYWLKLILNYDQDPALSKRK